MENPDKGYRRIRDDLERYHGIRASDKRILRIYRKKTSNPQLSIPTMDLPDMPQILSLLQKTFWTGTLRQRLLTRNS